MFWSQNTWPLSPSSGTPAPPKSLCFEPSSVLYAAVRQSNNKSKDLENCAHKFGTARIQTYMPNPLCTSQKRLDTSCHNCRLGRFSAMELHQYLKENPLLFQLQATPATTPVFGHLLPLSHIQSYLISGTISEGASMLGEGWLNNHERTKWNHISGDWG